MTRRFPFAVWLTMLIGTSFFLGVVYQKLGFSRLLLNLLRPGLFNAQAIVSPTWIDPFVLLVVGQSNVANYGSQRGRASSGSYALATNGVFRLEDPLPGASGTAGSPWPYWAALRQRTRPGSQIVVVSIAQGSSSASDWIDSGVHAQRLPQVLLVLREQGLSVDAVVWHQGETEAWSGADPVAYESALQRWIANLRTYGINAPVFVCLTTRDQHGLINPSIRKAQASVWNQHKAVYAGPDTDTLGNAYRSDGVHFNQQGLSAFASLLQQAMSHPSDQEAPRLSPAITPPGLFR